MKVYAYKEVIPKKQFSDTDALISVWKASWRKHGWEPVLLGINDAQKHPLYKQLNPKYEALPSINHPIYEAACFRRWLAVGQCGGALMVDYDVINYGFTPEDLQQLERPDNTPLQLLTLSGGFCPCAVYSTNFTTAALLFASWKPSLIDRVRDRGHISDQNILKATQNCFNSVSLTPSYQGKHWESAPLVHYCNRSMKRHQPRSEWIPKLRSF